jgi:hypothetical protein
MPAIPAFLLKKLYVKNSLKNTPAGVELEIKNTLAPGTIIGGASVVIDGTEYPLADTVLISAEGEHVLAEVSKDKPLTFGINTSVIIRLKGVELGPGAHKVSIPMLTREAGELKIEVSDNI